MLEQFAYSYIDQVEPGWVVNTMRSVGVPYEMLFEAYLVIFDAKVCSNVLQISSKIWRLMSLLITATGMARPARNRLLADPDIISDTFLVRLFGWTKCH